MASHPNLTDGGVAPAKDCPPELAGAWQAENPRTLVEACKSPTAPALLLRGGIPMSQSLGPTDGPVTQPKSFLQKSSVKVLGVLGVLVVAFLTAFVKTDATRNAACDHVPAGLHIWGCKRAHQQITLEEASVAIDHYLGRTSGASPQDEWTSLTPRAQQSWGGSIDRFTHSFDGVLWSERVGPIARVRDSGAINQFRVNYYVFRGEVNERPDPNVNSYTQVLQIVSTGSGTKISEVDPAARPTTYTGWPYPRVQTLVGDPTFKMRQYGGPSTSRTDGGDPTLAHGGVLVPFCRIQMPDGLWIMSATGWTPDEFLEHHGSDVTTIPLCDHHYGDVPGGPALSSSEISQTHPPGQ